MAMVTEEARSASSGLPSAVILMPLTSSRDKQRVFDRFYKTDKSRGLDKNGVGLGLYICKTIIEAHGESIGVVSEEGGCEFWFTLKEGSPVERRMSKPQEDEARYE